MWRRLGKKLGFVLLGFALVGLLALHFYLGAVWDGLRYREVITGQKAQ